MVSVFFQNALCHKLTMTALRKVDDCVRTAAELFYDRVLPAVSNKGVAVV